MRVLVQLRAATAMAATDGAAPMALLAEEAIGAMPAGFTVDATYRAVPVPTPVAEEPGADRFSLIAPRRFETGPEAVTHVVRGQIPDGVGQRSALAELHANPGVVGVFADPVIESTIVCAGDAAVGTDTDVAAQLDVPTLSGAGMDGTGVTIAVVDTGINLAHLRAKGRAPKLDAARSWTPAGVTTKPGRHPVDHGTMCAYDVGIAAPKATLLDYAVLLSRRPGATQMAGLLSDAVLAYSKLREVLDAMPASRRTLVVTNSWGMFSPSADFPVGHPGNYSDNPAHPFNVIVASLEAAGADILFAAGNCGRDCPDGRCQFGATRPICGANSHPAVLSVAGVDVRRRRVGYSSQGPGRLDARKPDLAGYTHFTGSGVFPADGGTSAACPVLAGFVGAVRTKHRAPKLPPSRLRSMLYKTADDLGGTGFDHDVGWGVPNASALLAALGGAGARARASAPARRRSAAQR
jgi:subtilisin family serine protease